MFILGPRPSKSHEREKGLDHTVLNAHGLGFGIVHSAFI